MRTKQKIIIGAICLVSGVVGYLFFLYFAFGGFEIYGPPINIVIPKGFEGIACGRRMEGEQVSEATWKLDSSGYFKVSGEIQSHRPLVIRYLDTSTGTLSPASDEVWNPLFTENDTTSHVVYSVFWVGNIDGWRKRVSEAGSSHLCLGRFDKKV